MKTIVAYLLLFAAAHSSAQSIDRSVMASAGQPLAGKVGSIHFTLSEPVVGPVGDGPLVVQGFWTGGLKVEEIDEDEGLEGLVVYPNPVHSELTVATDGHPVYGMTLFAMNGQMVKKGLLPAKTIEHQLDFSHLDKGVYVLQLHVEGNRTKDYKLIKE